MMQDDLSVLANPDLTGNNGAFSKKTPLKSCP